VAEEELHLIYYADCFWQNVDKLLWTVIGLSVMSVFFLLAALVVYDQYSGMLRNLKECEDRVSDVPNENSKGQALYFCSKAFWYNYHAQDQLGNIFVIISGIVAAIAATLFVANYKPSWFGRAKVSAS
jgi:hypothetical protein